MGQTGAVPASLRIQYRALDSLIPYERNPRTHSEEQIAQIAASIKEFGFTNPVLLDGENGVIAGHGRLAAARSLGLKTVPCIELGHLTPEQKRSYLDDLIRACQRYILDQQAQNPFPIARRRTGIVPYSGQVGGELLNPLGCIVTGQRVIRLGRARIFRLLVRKREEFFIPRTFQGIGDEPILGPYEHELAFRQMGFLTGPLV